MGAIVSAFGTILINTFSSYVYDKGRDFSARKRAKQDEEKINQWIENFFSSHDDPIFSSPQFNNWIVYQKVFDKKFLRNR